MRICPNCDRQMIMTRLEDEDHFEMWECEHCGEGFEVMPDFPAEVFEGHSDIEIDTKYGKMHALGDPNMSEATRQALIKIAELAYEAIDQGEIN